MQLLSFLSNNIFYSFSSGYLKITISMLNPVLCFICSILNIMWWYQ